MASCCQDQVGNIHLEANGYLDGNWHTYYFFNDLPPVASAPIVAGTGGIHPSFNWNRCFEPNLNHYHIYRKFNSPGYSYLAATTDTFYTDATLDLQNLGSSVTVYYYVKAEDDLSQESYATSAVSFRVDPNPKLIGQVLPGEISLSPNYPNPFNPETKIEYALPEFAHVSLKIYDMLGREVKSLVDADQEPGIQTINWNAKDMPSGLYFYRLKAGDFVDTKKMTLMK